MRIRLTAACCFVPLLLVSHSLFAVEPSRWATYQGSADHTGFVDTSVQVPLSAIPRWSRVLVPAELPGGGRYTGLAISDGRLYVTSPERFAAINPIVAVSLADGSPVWQRNFPNVNSVNPPAVSASGDVYLVTGNHASDTYLHRLNGSTGQSLSSTPMPAQWQRYFAPTIFEDQVATAGGENTGIYAFSLAGLNLYASGESGFDQWTPVRWKDRWVWLTDRLHIVDRATGAMQQTIPIPGFGWTGWSVWQTPVIVRDVAYLTQSNRLIAIELNTGLVRFIRPASDFQRGSIGEQISTDGEQLFVRADSELLVFDLEGNLLAAYANTPGSGFGPTNIVTRSHVLGWSAFGQVNMFDRQSCAIVKTFQGTADVAALALADGSLVVAYRDGRVSAFDIPFVAPVATIFRDGLELEPAELCTSLPTTQLMH